jgi:glycerol-3-phosphate dehydrogenase
VAIAGGKLTTYRRMAERVVDAVAGLVRVKGVEAGGLSARLPLSGGNADDQARARTEYPTRIDPDFDERMWSTYGLRARAILDRIGVQASLAEPIAGLSDLTAAEIDHAVHAEMAMTLDDVLRRRSRVGMYRTRHACAAAAQVAARMGAALGWDQGSMDRQIGEFCARGNGELSIVRGESTEEST